MAFLRDIQQGLETLRRVPGLVAVAVTTLALGIGANTVIFSVIYSVLLKPLVFPEPDRLVQVWMAFPERAIDRASWSHGNFWDARGMATAFDELGAMQFGDTNLTGIGDPEKLDGARGRDAAAHRGPARCRIAAVVAGRGGGGPPGVGVDRRSVACKPCLGHREAR